MLVLATFRDTEADVPAELADTLADLRRSDEVVRLQPRRPERGGRRGVRAPRRRREIDPASSELSHELRDLTEGNAFLLCELWRALVETER